MAQIIDQIVNISIQDAISGAEEVDAVVNIGFVKSRARKSVLKDVSEMVKAAKTVTFKLIVETAYLTEEEIVWASPRPRS